MWAVRLVQNVVIFHGSLATCILLLVAGGCQQSPTTVSGTVTLDRRPLSVAPDARGTVIFQPIDGQGTTSTGLLDSTGHFKLATGASSEIAPGKYHVAVSVVQLLPKSEQTEQGAKRISPAKYASASDSGLEADVAPGDNQLSFNLDSSMDDSAADASASTSLSPASSGSQPLQNSSENK